MPRGDGSTRRKTRERIDSKAEYLCKLRVHGHTSRPGETATYLPVSTAGRPSGRDDHAKRGRQIGRAAATRHDHGLAGGRREHMVRAPFDQPHRAGPRSSEANADVWRFALDVSDFVAGGLIA